MENKKTEHNFKIDKCINCNQYKPLNDGWCIECKKRLNLNNIFGNVFGI